MKTIKKPKRIKVVLPMEMWCWCGEGILWMDGELASKFEKRYNEFLKRHRH